MLANHFLEHVPHFGALQFHHLLRLLDGGDEAALLEACRERLPGYKKPKEFRRVRAFPLSSTGKIAKNVLRRRLESGEEPGETA